MKVEPGLVFAEEEERVEAGERPHAVGQVEAETLVADFNQQPDNGVGHFRLRVEVDETVMVPKQLREKLLDGGDDSGKERCHRMSHQLLEARQGPVRVHQ